MTFRKEKIESLISELAAEFLMRESGTTSLITVTRSDISENGSHAKIFFTVLPENREAAALDFVSRKTKEFREYVKPRMKSGRLPRFEFALDDAEKTRRKIDSL